VVPRIPIEPAPPDLLLGRFPARVVVDLATGAAQVVGHGTGRAVLEQALRSAAPAGPSTPGPGLPRTEWRSSLDREAFVVRVRAALELIAAGDCYQVNLTRRLTTARRVEPAALFAALARDNPAPHAALLRFVGSDVSVVSASPETFLRWDGRRVETRPIKGTAAEADVLAVSAKDRAENVMIVDLARNDLGRVCEFGSVHVPALCEIEAHPGLHHLVSTVRGTLRPDVGPGALIRATFPPASVTGAPKPRVLQAIEDLEPVRRGPYCGALGWLDTERGTGELAVAIRTFVAHGDRTHLGVGGGIVADSDPGSEWAETELKAARLLEAAAKPAPASRLAS
jgi:para-aminobenzoate synthetase component 1